MALPPKKTDEPEKKPDAQEEVFMREVDEAVRQQDMTDAAKKYGVPIGLALVLGLGGFGGWLWYSGQQEQASEAASEELVKTMDQLEAGNLDTAEKGFAPLAEGDVAGQKAAAKMVQAGIAVQKGEMDEAAKLFAELAADSDTPEAYRNLATIREVAIKFDDMKPEAIVTRLKPLATPGTAWFPSAGELLAAAYLEQEKPDLAGPLLAEIAKDEEAPESLRSRARQLAGVLGFDAVEDPEELIEEVAAAGEAATPAPAAQQ